MPEPKAPRPPQEVPATRMETSEEIREAILAAKGQRPEKAAPADRSPPASPPVDGPALERPLQRPPIAMLCIIDDGKQEGEWVRLRADRHVLGRVEGDIRIPHDVLMSGAHAEIVREKVKDGYRWMLNDLGSTNGTWVRIGSSPLRHGNEILIGRGHFLFEGGQEAIAPDEPENTKSTRPWQPAVGSLLPSLVEISLSGPGQRIALTMDEYWIGRDPSCAIVRRDDPLVSPKHARLHRDAKGRWSVDNHKSVNGLWYRIGGEIALGATCQFRLGEQRFLFRVS